MRYKPYQLVSRISSINGRSQKGKKIVTFQLPTPPFCPGWNLVSFREGVRVLSLLGQGTLIKTQSKMWPLTISTKVGEVDPLPSYWIYVYGVRCDLHQNPINIGYVYIRIYIYIILFVSLIQLNFCKWTCSIWIYVFWRLKNFFEKNTNSLCFTMMTNEQFSACRCQHASNDVEVLPCGGDSRFYHGESISLIWSVTLSTEYSIQQSQYEFEKLILFSKSTCVSPHIVYLLWKLWEIPMD